MARTRIYSHTFTREIRGRARYESASTSDRVVRAHKAGLDTGLRIVWFAHRPLFFQIHTSPPTIRGNRDPREREREREVDKIRGGVSKVSHPNDRANVFVCVHACIYRADYDDDNGGDDVEENYRSMEMMPPRDVYIRLDKFTRSPKKTCRQSERTPRIWLLPLEITASL